MALFELVVVLLFVGGLLALWANRVGVPYPALLALVGALVALVPGMPEVELDPELALALFVAPTLLDAAYDASPRDLRANIVPVVSLAVGMVAITVVVVALVARQVLPGMPWAAAIALGAIVAPPDASAASAVLRRLQPSHRLLVILEGESLFNDATALLIYRAAIGAGVTGAFSGWTVLPTLLVTCGGGVLVGWLLARAQIWLTRRIDDISINILMQFIATFAVWLIAEWVRLSAIITVVAFAMTLARRLAGRIPARQRITTYAVWDVAVLVLDVLAFVLIGLQLRGIAGRIGAGEHATFAIAAATVCVAVIAVRIAWVMTHTTIDCWHARRAAARGAPVGSPPTLRAGLVASWSGMRGVVTLAAALALPNTTNPFPYRDIIVFCAFCVVLTTLVLQGLTLRPLMHHLRLRDDDTVTREIGVARAETARAALDVLARRPSESHSARDLVREYEARLHAAEAGIPIDAVEEEEASVAALQLRAVDAQRDTLTALRSRRVIGDDAFHVVEDELDLIELTADSRIRPTVSRG